MIIGRLRISHCFRRGPITELCKPQANPTRVGCQTGAFLLNGDRQIGVRHGIEQLVGTALVGDVFRDVGKQDVPVQAVPVAMFSAAGEMDEIVAPKFGSRCHAFSRPRCDRAARQRQAWPRDSKECGRTRLTIPTVEMTHKDCAVQLRPINRLLRDQPQRRQRSWPRQPGPKPRYSHIQSAMIRGSFSNGRLHLLIITSALLILQSCLVRRIGRLIHHKRPDAVPTAAQPIGGVPAPVEQVKSPASTFDSLLGTPGGSAATADNEPSDLGKPEPSTVNPKPPLDERSLRIAAYLDESENNIVQAEKRGPLAPRLLAAASAVRTTIAGARSLQMTDPPSAERTAATALVLSRADFRPFISGSVGENGINQSIDVLLVREFLVRHDSLRSRNGDQATDELIDGIRHFQRTVVGWKNPDARVDPSGPTFKLLSLWPTAKAHLPPPQASKPPAPAKPAGVPSTPHLPAEPQRRGQSNPTLYTTDPNERLRQQTPANINDVIRLIRDKWPDLPAVGAKVMAAQYMHETGRGASMYNWNVGNIKCANKSCLFWFHERIHECEEQIQAEKHIATGKGKARLATDEEVKQHASWKCVPKLTILYFAPHENCKFRFYESLEAGISEFVKYHRGVADDVKDYRQALYAGDTDGVVEALADPHKPYFTGVKADYKKSLRLLRQELDTKFK